MIVPAGRKKYRTDTVSIRYYNDDYFRATIKTIPTWKPRTTTHHRQSNGVPPREHNAAAPAAIARHPAITCRYFFTLSLSPAEHLPDHPNRIIPDRLICRRGTVMSGGDLVIPTDNCGFSPGIVPAEALGHQEFNISFLFHASPLPCSGWSGSAV